MTGDSSRVPEELDAAMRRALNDNPSPTPIEVLEAAERLLERVLSGECENRSSALDLLTVDALMTANNIASTSTVIFPGQVLNIPAGGQGGAPATQPASGPTAARWRNPSNARRVPPANGPTAARWRSRRNAPRAPPANGPTAARWRSPRNAPKARPANGPTASDQSHPNVQRA